MKKRFSILVVSTVIVGLTLSLVGMALVSQAAPEPPTARKIVVFQPWFVNEPAREALVAKFGGVITKDLPLINGMAVLLPPKAEGALAKQVGVLRVDNDDLVFALGKPICNRNGICEEGETANCSDCKNGNEEEPTPQPLEEMAWGVNRIDADLAWVTSTGLGIKVAIIDSGIDLDHPDLMDNIKGGYNAINSRKSYDDDFRHGTHVAGIVAAVDNEIGVIGTAPEVHLYAVKVLNRRGIGFTSDIIDGLNWSIEHGMQVANMSIGKSGDNQSYHDAIIAAYNAGMTIVAAAGNDGTDFIYYPGRYPETIAASATCSNTESPDSCKEEKAIVMDANGEDGLAYFSSYASSIDDPNDDSSVVSVNLVAGPGEDINSTWNDGYYYVGSGTSMATPHIAGTAAMVLWAKGCTSLGQSGCTPDEIMNILKTSAEDLGPTEIDVYFGYGLVDAEGAVNSVTQ